MLNEYTKAYLNIINENTNVEKYKRIAKEIGGKYIAKTNTIDCKNHKVYFKNSWLNKDGSFDFKLINTNSNWGYMFEECDNLIYLPEDFIIPDHVTNCCHMFEYCYSLKELPSNFTIPNNVIDCYNMFLHCKSLKQLPQNFIIGNNVERCQHMFKGCVSLQQLSQNFTIPNSVKECVGMFWDCESLKELPKNFRIPANSNYSNIFGGCSHLININIDNYLIMEL